jgi:transposase
MNNNSSSKNEQNIIDKLDYLIDTVTRQTKTIENQTSVIGQLRSEILKKDTKLAEKDFIINKLKEQLGMNSQNSSTPPSTDGFKKPAPKSLRKPYGENSGSQKGHNGKGLTLMKAHDETIEHYPSKCERRPHIFACTSFDVAATRYEYDIVLETKLTCHKQMACSCPIQNNEKLSGTFPDSIKSSMQYGNNLRALVVTLNTSGMIALQRLHDILKATFGIPISTGAINNMIASMTEQLTPALAVIESKVTNSKVVHFDESSILVNGKNQWIHCSSTDCFTHLTVEEKRGEEGVISSGVLPYFNDTAIHDCWHAYFKFPHPRHGLCVAPLLRELTGIFENNPEPLIV